jgi:2-polyprenyl-6-methoxyphenol hydroxylase-like FAD-dependent oxidoreductase
MREVQDEYVVVGGGPAGSVVAGLLALRGHRVLVIEKEKFPRYHIGESLVTGTLPALDELGMRDRFDELGFVKKYGATCCGAPRTGSGTSGSPRHTTSSTPSRCGVPTSTRCCWPGQGSWGVDVIE